ncbi:hypothetical protein GCM10009001_08640 [Virgibacillus siamensis]|uniref:DUF5067 domain-containing protein n=1 Tax=Virgibacillus siamensis TaxID=480071 RepID=A0ABP3QSB0_9BACI
MRVLQIVVGIFLIVVLAACSGEPEDTDPTAAIKQAELSEFESSMMKLAGQNTFSFDIDINSENVSELHAAIKYYENSEMKNVVSKSDVSLSKQNIKKPIRITFIRRSPVKNKEEWITAVMTADGSSTTKQTLDVSDREEMSSTAWGGITEPVSLDIGEQQIVGTLVQTNQNSTTILNTIETNEQLMHATAYEQVYVMSITLK